MVFGQFVYSSPVNENTNNASTNWFAVWAIFLSGCTLAVHIGKLPTALPLLADEFSLTLAQTGNLVSIYALLVAFGALLAGVLVARIGYVIFAVAGVSLCLLGSTVGTFATNVPLLMVTRVIEGLGWVVGVVSIPVLLSTIASPKDRAVVMGLWGAFVPIGAGSILLLAPALLSMGGWRLVWAISSILSLLGVVTMIWMCIRQSEILLPLRNVKSSTNFSDLTQKPAIAALICFMCYSFQYVAVNAYLPTLLIEQSGMSLAQASFWAAVVVLFNAIGNIAAGWLINLGLKQWHILAAASLLMGLFAWMSLTFVSVPIRITSAILMTCAGGIIPGTLFSTAGLLASTTAGVGMIIGFMLTGTGLGQLTGPVVITRLVEWSGQWSTGGLLSLCVGLIGALFAYWLRHLPVVERETVKP